MGLRWGKRLCFNWVNVWCREKIGGCTKRRSAFGEELREKKNAFRATFL